MSTINFNDTDSVGKYLKNSRIVEMYTPSSSGLEGGLTIVFDKDGELGIYIMGYTELGDWVYHFDHKENFCIDTFYNKKINIIRTANGFEEIICEE